MLAAASLAAAYTEIGDAFETEHPGANVVLSFDASSALVTQINEGAPADVFASADEANMTKLTDAGGNAGEPQIFATNSLQIIVGSGNPKGITGVADLAQPGLLYVTCAPEVPIGKYAAEVLTAANVTVTPVSFEQNVKGIVTKVTADEADAGIVYKTDVIAAGLGCRRCRHPRRHQRHRQVPSRGDQERPESGRRSSLCRLRAQRPRSEDSGELRLHTTVS